MEYCRRLSRINFDGFGCYNSTNPISRHRFCWRRNFGEFGAKKQQGKRGPFDGSNNEFVPSKGWRRWIWNVENAVAMAVFGGGSLLVLSLGKIETVPFTKRKQLVTDSRSAFEVGGERKCEEVKKKFKEKVVDPVLPESVRVRKITEDLIEGFRRRSRKEKWHLDEFDDEKCLKVEFVFVDIPANRIASLPGGKILIFCDLKNHWERVKDDARLAAFIAPQIGHSVARHYEEKLMLRLIPSIPLLILHDCLKLAIIDNSLPSRLKCLRFPFARRMDAEADYIGLLLVACAGYDPRVALQDRERMARFNGDSRLEKMRTQLLAIHMDEALSIYYTTHHH
ncbi:hypothetical protein C2S53_018463 [Perilla frutescens var. hirtella]|uniref:Peptidase M48 domain-containing protein n=1 Tax=Perilla frutescens var. hirtella TaxID=608512 RepID=A0AAD4P6Z1_PERFH|nr:hypothetical protein C2S53_018463 [Perilla frutescens var. hirtella]